jgi:hypothetical protein
MSTAGGALGRVQPYALEVEALDLGGEIQAAGLELLERESREPVRGPDASEIWAAVIPALAAGEYLVLDFFSHLERVRDFCQAKSISFREEAGRCLVIPQPLPEQLVELLARFAGETLGARAGIAARAGDPELEGELSQRGLDAYQTAYQRYTFCAVCELEDGWVTLLSGKLSTSDVARRVKAAAEAFAVQVTRPH